MCGLVGVAGDIAKIDIDVFNQLLFADTLRGQDSTGVAGINLAGDVDWIKRVGIASDLQDIRGYDRVVNNRQKILIGHNRYGTQGAKSNANAHPFECGDVVGAHNGTVPWDSKNKLPKASTFGTDSEAIFNAIDEIGVEKTLGLLHGAWALTYWDARDDTLNFIRNKERPLYYAFNAAHTTMFWASEEGLLHWILGRNGIKYDKPTLLIEDTLLSFTIPAFNKEFDEPRRQKITGAAPVVPVSVPARFPTGSYDRGTYKPYNFQRPDAPKSNSVANYDPNDWSIGDDETLEAYFRRTDGLIAAAAGAIGATINGVPKTTEFKYKHPITNALMTRDEFDEITQHGCDWCNNDVMWGTHASFIASSTGDPECFCEDCTLNNNEAKLYIRS